VALGTRDRREIDRPCAIFGARPGARDARAARRRDGRRAHGELLEANGATRLPTKGTGAGGVTYYI